MGKRQYFLVDIGEFSFSLFLGHGFWSQRINELFTFCHYIKYSDRLIMYFIISVITGLFIMYVSKGLKYAWNRYGCLIKTILIKQE